jgi:hypothetical protein
MQLSPGCTCRSLTIRLSKCKPPSSTTVSVICIWKTIALQNGMALQEASICNAETRARNESKEMTHKVTNLVSSVYA